MNGIPDELVAAVGRITIAAGELELVLAWIGGDQADGNAFNVLAKPGEPLRAARRSVEAIEPAYQAVYLSALERAAQALAQRHAVVHAMWVNDAPGTALRCWELLHYKTHLRRPADPQTLDEIVRQLLEVRNELVRILTAQINRRPAPTATP